MDRGSRGLDVRVVDINKALKSRGALESKVKADLRAIVDSLGCSQS